MSKDNLIAGKTYFAVLKEGTANTGFYDEACREFYLRRLLHCLGGYQVKLHAYLLEPNQVLLLVTPLTPTGFGSLLRFLNHSYSGYFSTRFSRPVRVWRDAAAVCLLPSQKLVLDSQKFIERFPLRSKSHRHPGEHQYSSYCSNSFCHRPQYLAQHPAFKLFLGRGPQSLNRYREFVATPFAASYYLFLESRLMLGRPLLGARPQYQLENSQTRLVF